MVVAEERSWLCTLYSFKIPPGEEVLKRAFEKERNIDGEYRTRSCSHSQLHSVLLPMSSLMWITQQSEPFRSSISKTHLQRSGYILKNY